MDIDQKDMYETYEFPLGTSTEHETEQFLVVQNNGTFLLNMNKDVQYVTDMQDVNKVLESVQSCAVFDTATQQYYVDVDNTSELISVSDQFMLPENESNDAYTNNYLLQPMPEESCIELPDAKPESNESREEYTGLVVQETNNLAQAPESTLTEITLNDNQWKMLEEKGWVLLEFNDKIFLLNTLGLHDITDNQKMVDKFRSEVAEVLQNAPGDTSSESSKMPPLLLTDVATVVESPVISSSSQTNINANPASEIMGILKIEYNTESEPQVSMVSPKMPITPMPKLTTAPALTSSKSLLKPIVNYTSANSSLLKSSVIATTTPTSLPKTTAPTSLPKTTAPTSLLKSKQNPAVKVTKPKPKKYGRFLRLETTLKAQDIPQKLVLGKTLSGKNLIAKVIGVHTGVQTVNAEPKSPSEDEQSSEMEKLYRHFLSAGGAACRSEHVARAERVVRQLLAVPATRTPLLACNLLITMVQTTTDSKGTRSSPPALVTGRVARMRGMKDSPVFVYVDQMLQKMNDNNTEEEYEMMVSGSAVRLVCARAQPGHLLQVHVAERRAPPAPPHTNITFAKRRLPIQAISKKIPSLHACASCAQYFDCEQELLDHQQKCVLVKDLPPADVADKTPSDIKTETPTICDAPDKTEKDEPEITDSPRNPAKNKPKDAPFKCKMCPSTYYYSSSLSKHIMKQHIEEKIKNG